MLDPTSVATPDGETVIAATGGGNWLLVQAVGGQSAISALALNVIGNGAADDGPAIQAALVATIAFGVALWFPGGHNFRIATPVSVPDGARMLAEKTTTFTAAIAGAAVADSMFVAATPANSGSATTLSGAVVVGSQILPLTGVAGVVVGGIVRVTAATSTIPAYYRIIKITGLNATVDRAIVWPFQGGDAVQPVANPPPQVVFEGNNCLWQGVCVLFWYGAWWNSRLEKVRISNIPGASLDAIAGWHQGSYDCVMSELTCDGFGLTVSLNAQFGTIGAEDCHMARMTADNGGASCSAYKLDDSKSCTLSYSSASGNSVGVLLSTDFGVTTNASTDCTLVGNEISGNATNIDIGSGSTGTSIVGGSANYNTNAGSASVQINGGGGLAGTTLNGVTIHGNAGFGATISAGSKGSTFVGCTFDSNANNDFEPADEYSLISCYFNSTGGVSVFQAFATATLCGNIDDCHFSSTTIAGAVGVIHNDGGQLSITSTLIEMGTNGDVAVWNSGASSTPVTKETHVIGRPIAGATGTNGNFIPSGTMRIGTGCDFGACATPLNLGAGFVNRKQTVTFNGATPVAIPWPDAKSTDVLLLGNPSGTLGTLGQPTYTITPGTGFSVASQALDTSTREYTVA